MTDIRQSGPVFTFDGISPHIGKNVFVAPTAAVIGDVTTKDGASIWFSSVVRGDDMPITIGFNTNIQDGAVIHSTEKVAATVIGDNVVVGHGQNGDLSDGALAPNHASGPLVNCGQIRVHVPRIPSTPGHFLTGGRYLNTNHTTRVVTESK